MKKSEFLELTKKIVEAGKEIVNNELYLGVDELDYDTLLEEWNTIEYWHERAVDIKDLEEYFDENVSEEGLPNDCLITINILLDWSDDGYMLDEESAGGYEFEETPFKNFKKLQEYRDMVSGLMFKKFKWADLEE